MTWDQEVDLLKRELARAHASLKLEEARNAGLPELAAIQSPEEFQKRGNEAITRYIDFLKKRDPLPDAGQHGSGAARKDRRVRCRSRSGTSSRSRPTTSRSTLYTHFYHWWDLARMRDRAARERRSGAGRCSTTSGTRAPRGWRPRWKNSLLHAGLFDDEPRAREIIWIMLAQRAGARARLALRAGERSST